LLFYGSDLLRVEGARRQDRAGERYRNETQALEAAGLPE
jgi:hypothetical protein